MKQFVVVVASALAALPCPAAVPSFERDITPILRVYCSGCHNDRDREGAFSVETFTSLRKGGAESGDPIVAGDAAASALVRRITSDAGDHMPPADEPQVPAADLAVLEAWITAGAAGPAVDASILQSLVVPKLPAHVGAMPVTSAALAPSGGRLALLRGRLLQFLPTALHEAAAAAPEPNPGIDLPWKGNAVHFSPDGTSFVVAGGVSGLSGVAELRDAVTGRLVRAFGGHRDVLYDAEFSPDGKTLATAGYDRSIKLWNLSDGALLRSIDVHNGAIFDLAWHPTGAVLASASADETIKLWRTSDGIRLDTLSQPQGDMVAVVFTPDGRHVVGAGRDKRIHLWKLVSLEAPAINPPLHSRFAHESPIVAIGLSPDGASLLTSAEDRSLKVWSVPDLVLEHDYPRQSDQVSTVTPLPDGRFMVGRMDGSFDAVTVSVDPASPVAAVVAPSQPLAAAAAPGAGLQPAIEREPNDLPGQAVAVSLPAEIKGRVARAGDADCFRFTARRGEPLLMDVNAARSKSQLDSRIEVLDAAGNPVEQVILQATRDSWFTFRGKDSTQPDDFRLQNWMEMELDEYLYAAGEVVRLWRYPQGPDSGFWVYPGSGKRHTFFGTSAVTHALGEPAWIVEPLPPGSRPVPNGLPVFRIFFENDDDPTQRSGVDSQLVFAPPADGDYCLRLTDARGFGGSMNPDEFRYTLTIRPPQPSFTVTVEGRDPKVSRGSSREVTFTATRTEGFTGPIRVDVGNLPAGFTFHGPIEIEAGQQKAIGVLSASADAVEPDAASERAVAVRATAMVAGREEVREIGTLGDIQAADKAKVTIAIAPGPDVSAVARPTGEPLEFSIRPGQTITARVRAQRHDFAGQIELGGADSGRNLPHAVFVDNIGLNGLLIVEGETEREFFITAAPIAKPCRRLFHLRTTADGNQASVPAVINVLPAE